MMVSRAKLESKQMSTTKHIIFDLYAKTSKHITVFNYIIYITFPVKMMFFTSIRICGKPLPLPIEYDTQCIYCVDSKTE